MNELYHEGVKRRSGRYPWGSGENPYQHESWSWLTAVKNLKSEGLSDDEIANAFGMSKSAYDSKFLTETITQLKREGYSEKQRAEYLGMTINKMRSAITIANEELFPYERAEVFKLKEKGWSNVAIGEKLGISEGKVRNLLKSSEEKKKTAVRNTADVLKTEIEDKKYIDVGYSVERYLGISRQRLDAAIHLLEEEGYKIQKLQVKQALTDNYTTMKVLTKEDIPWSEVNANKDKIAIPLGTYSENNGETFTKIREYKQLDSKRIQVRYNEEGGVDKDGVIEIRRGVADLSLGKARYAQVRIGVDGTHYLKGMAMYSDDIPDGVDIIFNTNKHLGTPMLGPKDNTVLKPISSDPENPFKATTRQKEYDDANGNKQISPLNIVREEGDWSTWSKRLSSQVLSKQYVSLARKQLDIEYGIKNDEYNEIMELTNPVVKRLLLNSLADDCDSSAVDLNAAALPRQGSYVILPLTDIKDNEIYAPTYKDGEEVALIRYPHGGIFEIPRLKVNNSNKQAKRLIENATDAVGISSKVAERLSGADFDGDTVLVIPTNTAQLKTSDPLKDLKGFDPKEQYKGYEGMKRMTSAGTQHEMGKISNLITDMTLQGATPDELARAVKHSMVVIDAEKHGLDYQQSFKDNRIAELKEKYQGSARSGASTLISRAGSQLHVPERKAGEYRTDPETGKTKLYYTDPDTGEKLFRETGRTIKVYSRDEEGNKVKIDTGKLATKESTKMAETKDAYSLSSGTKMESIYADYANNLKALANKARLEASRVPHAEYNSAAAKTYATEVASLKDKVNYAEMNKPLERKAQAIADQAIRLKIQDNPVLKIDKDALTKVKQQEIQRARDRVGANSKKSKVPITDKEWEAIQAGAVSDSFLQTIIANSDLDLLKQYSMPRQYNSMSLGKIARAQSLLNSGYTLADVADKLGVSTSTLTKVLKQ